jgi:hypothetical protein
VRSITLDSNIYVSALKFGGKPLTLVEKGVSGEVDIAVSEEIIEEMRNSSQSAGSIQLYRTFPPKVPFLEKETRGEVKGVISVQISIATLSVTCPWSKLQLLVENEHSHGFALNAVSLHRVRGCLILQYLQKCLYVLRLDADRAAIAGHSVLGRPLEAVGLENVAVCPKAGFPLRSVFDLRYYEYFWHRYTS